MALESKSMLPDNFDTLQTAIKQTDMGGTQVFRKRALVNSKPMVLAGWMIWPRWEA